MTEMQRFVNFVRNHFRVFRTVDPSEWLSTESWLDGTSYSARRKQELLGLAAAPLPVGDRLSRCKSFVKDEAYDEEKWPRAINSYDDNVKVHVGPVVKTLEKCFFSHRWFVKGKTNAQRDAMLRECLGSDSVCFTDFTSFEAHHHGPFADLFLEFLDYLGLTQQPRVRATIRQLVLGRNTAVFDCVDVSVDQRLMSGAMWTSFQNSFLNLFIMQYLRFRADPDSFDFRRPKIFVEGDDGICKSFHWDRKVIEGLGIRLKIEYAPHFSLASFCGRTVTEDGCVTNPLKALQKLIYFSWKYGHCARSKIMALYKAKAMSFLETYPGCPIVQSVCVKIIQDLRAIDHRVGVKLMDGDWFLANTGVGKYDGRVSDFIAERVVPVTDDSKLLVETLFGLTVSELTASERAIDEWVCTLAQRDQCVQLPISWPHNWCEYYWRSSS